MSSGKKILIAEDDDRILNGYKFLFQFHKDLVGLEVFWAKTAHEFERIILKENPQLSLLDLGLGDGIPGYDALKNLQGVLPETCRIVVLSGYPEYQDICMAAGASGFLKKPLTKDEFLIAISQYLV